MRIINECCNIHNFIRIEQLNDLDPVLESQDSRMLAVIDNNISKE